MKQPILLVLAAGMGSRFGGLKQMEPVGPSGEVLLDFSVFDAIRSGFGKAVFIIRHDFEQDFREIILARVAKKIHCELAFQGMASLMTPAQVAAAAGRTKPWGTAHAVACAAPHLDAPFAVINADDFYGARAVGLLGAHLAGPSAETEGAIVPYRLGDVLSDSGPVNRGYCEAADGYLAAVREIYKIRDDGGVIRGEDRDGVARILDPGALVSMNCWGFPTRAAQMFVDCWRNFIEKNTADLSRECLLQDAVMGNIADDALRVKMLSAECGLPDAVADFSRRGLKTRALDSGAEYFGMTYREDLPMARARIADLIAAGEYPSGLWNAGA